VFELTPNVSGSWTEKILHSFNNDGKDGINPSAGLIFDCSGNLYGTTSLGGAFGTTYTGGTVFEFSPQAGVGWTEKILHSFNFNGKDGYSPTANLIFDAFGNLYGTTNLGGSHNDGTVFQLTPSGSGQWAEVPLHDFGRVGDGQFPYVGLISDRMGNLYGTTSHGGAYGEGTAFELTRKGGGVWNEKILHSFHNDATDGSRPYASLMLDAAGNVYGTTVSGGTYGYGTVFELIPSASGGWSERVLHDFNFGTDGYSPDAGLILDNAGNLYGTTPYGGTYNSGTVFEIRP
jgi:uncharacterized repeat protein (TIGR03803 family)